MSKLITSALFSKFTAYALFVVVGFGVMLSIGLIKVELIASNDVTEVASNYKIISNDDLAFLNDSKSFIFFTSGWCGPCQNLSSLYATSAIKYPEINFYQLDMEQSRSIANHYNINIAPSLILLQNKKVVVTTEVNISDIQKVIDRSASL